MAAMRSTSHAHAEGDDTSRTDREKQANKNNVSGKIIWIEYVTRSARCAKADIAYGHIKQERGGIPGKQK